MNITKITLIRSKFHSDKLILYTDLPPTTYPFNERATMTMEVSAGDGLSYCRFNFTDIPVTEIWRDTSHLSR